MGRITLSVVQSALPDPARVQHTFSLTHRLYNLFTASWKGNLHSPLAERGTSEHPFPPSRDSAPQRGRALGSWAAPPLQVETEVTPLSTEDVGVATTVPTSRSGSVFASRSESVSISRSASLSALTGPPSSASVPAPASNFSPVAPSTNPHALAPGTTLGQSFIKDTASIDKDVPANAAAANDTGVLQRVGGPPVQRRKPIVKVLLYGTGGEGVLSRSDVKYFRRVCRAHVKGVDAANIRVHLGGGKVGEEFKWFFSPEDIVPSDMLILLITGHAGFGRGGGVVLQLQTPEGTPIDTMALHKAISELPAYCTLEVVLGTCHAEAVIGGLHRLWVADSAPTEAVAPNTNITDTYGSASGSHRDGNYIISVPPPANSLSRATRPDVGPSMFRSLLSQANSPTIRATVIVWAAAVKDGFAYPEATLPGRPGKYCAMIGAMCRALDLDGPNITRRALSIAIGEAAKSENMARKERDSTKTADQLARLGPRIQVPLLLSSLNDPDRVLNTYAFQPFSVDSISTV